MRFKEDLLQYIWKFQKFERQELKTTKQLPIVIKHPGLHNFNSGPDFLQGEVIIDKTRWIGSIEIHIKSSDWISHKHSLDPAYANVILHVVYKHDTEIKYPDGTEIPTLCLSTRISNFMIEQYGRLMLNQDWVPCSQFLKNISPMIKSHWLERMSIERLEKKTEDILTSLMAHQNNWDLVAYKVIAKHLGYKVNNEAFSRLFEQTKFDLFIKHQSNLFQLEALIFGQAGFLTKPVDDYCKKLNQEYEHLKNKYKLQGIKKHEWKFSRMRPLNFPTIRMAQLCAMIHTTGRIFQKILASRSVIELEKLLSVTASKYWDTHYRFGVVTKPVPKKIGSASKQILIINAIVPLLFAYGIKTQNQAYKEEALKILHSMVPEKNKIISAWNKSGYKGQNAGDSQALLHLKREYCDKYQCLRCSIGNEMFSKVKK